MKVTATRRIQFCAGHRVTGHENKCRNMHGHNYVALITAKAAQLDSLGRIIDFAVLKNVLGDWIDNAWDHGFILWNGDAEARDALALMPETKIYLMSEIPTAENIAVLLKAKANELLSGSGVHVSMVRIWETENCYADAD